MATALPPAPPRTAIQVLARLKIILDAASSLMRDNFRILLMLPTSLSALPAIRIAADPRLAGMVERNEAAYYFSDTDARGPYRVGQFERLGCRVIWIERGH